MNVEGIVPAPEILHPCLWPEDSLPAYTGQLSEHKRRRGFFLQCLVFESVTMKTNFNKFFVRTRPSDVWNAIITNWCYTFFPVPFDVDSTLSSSTVWISVVSPTFQRHIPPPSSGSKWVVWLSVYVYIGIWFSRRWGVEWGWCPVRTARDSGQSYVIKEALCRATEFVIKLPAIGVRGGIKEGWFW
jgi:hypothetical protein